MKKILTLMVALTGLFSAQAQQTKVEVTFYSPSIVRIYKASNQNNDSKKSLSVTMQPQQVKVTKSQEKLDKNVVIDVYKTDKLTVNILGGNVSFRDNKGNLLLMENVSSINEPTPEKPLYSDAGVRQTFKTDADEPIYGVGILQEGRMDMRGTNRRMIQGNTDDYCNIIQSIKGYGLFWDNYSPTTFISNEEGFQFISDNGGCIDYYFIYGGDADGVIAGIRQLTGTVPMLPLWSYGFMQSRERYKTSFDRPDAGFFRRVPQLGQGGKRPDSLPACPVGNAAGAGCDGRSVYDLRLRQADDFHMVIVRSHDQTLP